MTKGGHPQSIIMLLPFQSIINHRHTTHKTSSAEERFLRRRRRRRWWWWPDAKPKKKGIWSLRDSWIGSLI
jgi:hypothetical protein